MQEQDRNYAEWLEQVAASADRYTRAEPERLEVERQREAKNALVVDSPDQLRARAEHLAAVGAVPLEAMIELGRTAALDEVSALERIIGASSQLQAANFLSRGTRAAATVARVSLMRGGREIPLGTGFLVSPRLLMTNNHVIPDLATVGSVFVEFGAETSIDNGQGRPARFRLDPGVLVTDRHLDYSVVAVTPDADGRSPGDRFGWNRLIVQQGKAVVGDSMNIIGHPSGRLKEIAIRDNTLDLQLDDFLHYATDTEPGNSGSPVFNDQWEVVALHHSGVPRTDNQGRILRKDGQLWRRGDGDGAIDWVANEGARVSVILKHLAARQLSAQQRVLLDEMGVPAPVAPAPAHPAPAPPAPASAPAQAGAAEGGAAQAGTGQEAVAADRGLRARAGAFGGGRHLVFLHGRRQQGRDVAELRRTWVSGLNKGLTLAGHDPVNPLDVWFPFYGDVLAELVDGRENAAAAAVQAPAEAMAPAGDAARRVYEELIESAAADAGMPVDEDGDDTQVVEAFGAVGGWFASRLQRQLSWIARRSRIDDAVIAASFRDVARYLSDDRVRGQVLDQVLRTLPERGGVTLVGHSLGSVVAMDLLTRLPRDLDVDVLVTAGSPLGLDAVHNRLLAGGPHRPERVGHWLNAWAAADPVAIGCPLRKVWRGQLQEVPVDNPLERVHSISEYLSHPAVATAVHSGLTAALRPVS